jgi:hypothetical protein
MNDFTKDELEELYFFTCVHKNRYQVEYPQELLDKIQSMIDNYCEHEETNHNYASVQQVNIDWPMNMANSIVGQILNNEHCKKEFARILAIAALKIDDALKQEYTTMTVFSPIF